MWLLDWYAVKKLDCDDLKDAVGKCRNLIDDSETFFEHQQRVQAENGQYNGSDPYASD